MEDAARGKPGLRRAARRIRAGCEPGAAAQAVRRVLALEEIAHASVIALYEALPGEVPAQELRAALEARGARLAYPRLERESLALCEVGPRTPLARGSRGVAEPPVEAPRIAVESVDVFVVPGLLFDRHGARLGRGGGHYDRLLARARASARFIGLCYAERVVDRLPVDPWDVRMHVVITDREELR